MTNNDKSWLAAVIKDVVDDNGRDILKDPGRVNALLADLIPAQSKERELICRVLREGAGTRLLAASDKPEPKQRDAVMRCILQIKNNTYFSEEAIIMTVLMIADAIDIDWRSVISEKRDNAEKLTGTVAEAVEPQGSSGEEGTSEEPRTEELWNDAVRIVVRTGYCSTSFLQRKFYIGYDRAAELIDRMEKAGVVGPRNGPEPRRTLITETELPLYLKP